MSDIRQEPRITDADSLTAHLAASNRSAPRSPSEALQPESVPPPPPRSRAARHPLVVFLNFLLTIVVVAAVGLGAGLFIGKAQFERPGELDQALTFTVQPNAGVREIADQLSRAGAISSKWLFIAGVWMNREWTNLKPGEYLIPAAASMESIMASMVEGRGILYSLSIPEGLTSYQIVQRLMENDVLVGEISEIPAEGSLLPETYKFSRGDTRQNMLARMQRERDRVVTDIWSRKAPDLPLSNIDELVILASIVEKETALADERSRVAAVFINRLRLDMRLQSDPTVIYGLFGGEGLPPGRQLTRDDLKSESLYNTYVIAGLPPEPIANPGKAALEAVANPSRTRDLFFVADGSGGHAFAENYEEHLRNVARWREINQALTLEESEADAAAAPTEEGEVSLQPPARPDR